MGLLVGKDTVYENGGYRKVKNEAKKPAEKKSTTEKGNGKGGKQPKKK